MAQQIKNKFIGNDQVDGDKILLEQSQSIRAKDSSDQEVDLISLGASDEVLVKGQEVGLKSDIDAIEDRLDIIEGADTVEGSIAKAEKDAKEYADQKITDLVGSAPAVLDTLNELASALGSDPNFATTVANQIAGVQSAVDEVEDDVSNLVTLSGMPVDSQHLGEFTGTTIPDSQTIKEALQALETAVESVSGGGSSTQTELDNTQEGAGLNTDGSYIEPINSNYLSGTLSLAGADMMLDTQIKVNEDAIAQEVIDRADADSDLQDEIDATQQGAGLEVDGSYVAPVGSNYLGSATSLKDADSELDSQIKVNADAIAEVADNIADHISQQVGAHEASAISVVAIEDVAGSDVQAVLEDLKSQIDNHLSDTEGAHSASAISVSPAGNLAASDTQAALEELQGDIDTINQELGELSFSAEAISFAPAGDIEAVNVQDAIEELDSEKVAKAGDVLTGTLEWSDEDVYSDPSYSSTALTTVKIGEVAGGFAGSKDAFRVNYTYSDNDGSTEDTRLEVTSQGHIYLYSENNDSAFVTQLVMNDNGFIYNKNDGSGSVPGDISFNSQLVHKKYVDDGDASLQSQIDSLSDQVGDDLQDAISGLQSAVTAEESARIAGDSSLQSAIDDEASARIAGDSSLQSAIDTEKSRVDAILDASDADKDSFAEIVSLINSVDTENDQAFAGYVQSNNAALAQEILDRQSGDTTLQDQINTLKNFSYDQTVHVAKNGLDTNSGKQHSPFLTITAAQNSILDASPTKRYVVKVAPGLYTESIDLKANVFIAGEGNKEAVRINGAVSLASDFSGSGDHRSGFNRITLLSAADFNWATVTSAAGKLYVSETVFASTVNMYGHNNAIAQAQFADCQLFGKLTISGINVGVFHNNFCWEGIELNQHPNGGMATILNAVGGTIGGELKLTTTVDDFNRRCSAFVKSCYTGQITIDGIKSYVDATNDSIPAAGATILNSGNLIRLNDTGLNRDLSNLSYPTAVNYPIMPANSGATNLGDWGKQWAWTFSYVHASSGSDAYLISYGSSFGADSVGRNVGIIADGAGLQENVSGGNISISTSSAVSGTGIRGKVILDGREIDASNKQIKNLASGTDAADAINKGQLDAIDEKIETEKNRIDALESQTDGPFFSNGSVTVGAELAFIDLDREYIKMMSVAVGRLSIHEGEDYTVSVVGGVTRLTFINSLANPDGEEKIETGDKVFFVGAY
jgi:hypothetical protein